MTTVSIRTCIEFKSLGQMLIHLEWETIFFKQAVSENCNAFKRIIHNKVAKYTNTVRVKRS